MSFRLAHEMRPGEIVEAKEQSGCAFVPVSPAFEWHSFHLPLGTDAIISETLARLVAQRVHGICFPVLSIGLDEFRPENQLLEWGFKATDRVYGMNFPELPLTSEYARREDMQAILLNRIGAIRDSGFRKIFIVNHHGGTGQNDELQKIADEQTSEKCSVLNVKTSQFCTLKEDRYLKTGGHAGLSETMFVLAFRPDLVDMAQLPDGELEVCKYGILHNKPVIESEWNPRHALIAIANELRKNMVENFVAFIRKHQS